MCGYCFGCQRSGDAITFVRELEHLDFVDAVERLAARAGITLRYDDASHSADRKRKQRLHEAVGAAITFYHQLLLDSPDDGGPRAATCAAAASTATSRAGSRSVGRPTATTR